jgi:hypothetical protein
MLERVRYEALNKIRLYKSWLLKLVATGRDRNRRRETDGTAPAGAIPSKSPWPRHIARRLPAYTPSTSENSGTPRAAAGKDKSCTGAALPSRTAAAKKQTLDLAVQLRQGSIERLAPGIEDDGPLWAQLIEVETHGLADAAPNAVTDHGFAEGPRSGEADVRSVGLWLADAECREEGARETGTRVINSSEVFRSQQADTFRESRDGALPFGADREFFAAPRAAAGQDGPAVLGFHAGSEPVRLGAMAIIRLKSTFRHFSSTI